MSFFSEVSVKAVTRQTEPCFRRTSYLVPYHLKVDAPAFGGFPRVWPLGISPCVATGGFPRVVAIGGVLHV